MILGPNGENIYPEEIEAVINEFEYVQESLVFQQDGKLTAKVHLNYEELKKQFKEFQESSLQIQKRCRELLQELLREVNARINVFSRLSRMIEQLEPFEKTPTQKIKRYLYLPQVAKGT